MRANQETIENDYVINDLRGTTGKDVDIANYYDAKNTSTKSDKSYGVTLTVEPEEGYEADEYKYIISTNEDLSDAREIVSSETSIRAKNLFSGTKYYWKVVAGEKESKIESFVTENYVRWIDCDAVYNVRDEGGYMTSSGQRVKQGLVYRGGEITTRAWSTDHTKTNTEEAKRVFRDEMGVRCELDLRREGDLTEGNSGKSYKACAFAEDGDIDWVNSDIQSYGNCLSQDMTKIKKCFDTIAKADEAPVYFHCHGGADRTGTIGFLLLSLLGCSYTDVAMDFELTSYSSIGGGDCHRCHLRKDGMYDDYPGMISTFQNLTKGHGETLQEQAEYYLKVKCKVSQDNIDYIKEIMLEDVE